MLFDCASISLFLISTFWSVLYVTSDCVEDNRDRSSFLWSIQKNDNNIKTSYFYGTIHVPYTKVWDFVNPVVKTAFQKSDTIFFELNLSDHETLKALARCQLLPEAETLGDKLPPSLYKRLWTQLEQIRLNLPDSLQGDATYRRARGEFLFRRLTDNWKRKRPVWIMILLNALNEMDVRNHGIPVLDLFLANQAHSYSKSTGAIENVSEQCDPLNDLDISTVIFALNETLNRISAKNEKYFGSRISTTQDLIDHYNCGNLNEDIFNRDSIQLPDLLNNSESDSNHWTVAKKSIEIDKYFQNELIAKRNKRMAHRVIDILESAPHLGHFFALGAGHFLGNYSILDIVRHAGYKVIPVTPKPLITNIAKITKGSVPYRRFVQLNFPNSGSSRKSQVSERYNWRPLTSKRPHTFNELWIHQDETTPSARIGDVPKSHSKEPYNTYIYLYHNSSGALKYLRTLAVTIMIFVYYL